MPFKLINQHDERDCGAACLSMIATNYGLKESISFYRELTKTDRSGTNLYGLVDGARQIGLKAEALQGVPDDLLEGIDKGEIRFPFIAHTISEQDMLHYVVVYGTRNKKFLICDPGSGKRSVPLEQFFSFWTGFIVTFEKTAAFQPANRRKGTLSRFLPFLKGQYSKLISILLISLFISGIGMLGTFVFEIVIDDFAFSQESEILSEGDIHEEPFLEENAHDHDHEEKAHSESFVESLFEDIGKSLPTDAFNAIFLALIGLYLTQTVIHFVRGYLIIDISRKIDLRLSLAYYNHLIDLPVSSISVRQTGEYMSRFADTDTIRDAISEATLTLILDSIMVIVSGVILFNQNHRLFLIALIVVALYAIVILAYRKPMKKSNRRMMENSAAVQSYFKESIDGISTVKAACANEQVKKTTEKKFNAFLNSAFTNGLLSVSQESISTGLELIGNIIILWLGFSSVLTGAVTVGSLVSFYMLLAYFIEPIKNLIGLQPTMQSAIIAADRLNDILDLTCEQTDLNAKDTGFPDGNEWTIDGVDFRYGNNDLTLKGVSLSVKKGEKIAIVGESGSGKTTLAKLLLRFYEPEHGNIHVDGIPIGKLDVALLRENVAYVDQDAFLFSDSIKNNIVLGHPNVTEEEFSQACRISLADTFINKLPMGYDTPLNENGSNLSGGQRQRIAIARALLKKPKLLILDEATSHLDTITEMAIKNTLASMNDSPPCIVIAHRLSAIKDCDRIYVMDDGQILEAGTHEELIALNGKYASIWKTQ